MPDRKPLAAVPRGLIDVPVTPFTPDNKVDLDTFGRVIEFLLRHNASSLCINLHLAESLNLTLDERKLLAKAAVEVTAGRVPVIVHVSMPGTDQAVDLARHAEQVGADCVIAIAPYYWKPSQEQLYEHFSAIISATELPFIAYNSPTIMDGVGIAPATLIKLMQRFPKFIGLKEASHNWEKYLELGRAAKSVRPDFGLFVGTEWIDSMPHAGRHRLHVGLRRHRAALRQSSLRRDDERRPERRARRCNTNFPSSIRSPRSNIPRRPRRCGRSWGGRSAPRGCPTARSRRRAKKPSGRRSKRSGSSTANRMDGRQHLQQEIQTVWKTRETTMRKILSALVAAAGLLALAAAPSLAQEWPTRGTIRMIVPYPAGGGTDVVARIVAKYLSERLQQTIIVENRGGANGQVGLQALKQSAPDGYTMAMTSD